MAYMYRTCNLHPGKHIQHLMQKSHQKIDIKPLLWHIWSEVSMYKTPHFLVYSRDPNGPVSQDSVFGGRVKNRFVDLKWPIFDNTRQEYLHIGKYMYIMPYI